MLVEYLDENLKNTYLKKFKFNEVKRLTLYDYSNILNDSKIVFSPSEKFGTLQDMQKLLFINLFH